MVFVEAELAKVEERSAYTSWDASLQLEQRLVNLFRRNGAGQRPFNGDVELFQSDPHWRDLIQFNEYFHGDNGRGVGASHQTGWTGLVAKLIQPRSVDS